MDRKQRAKKRYRPYMPFLDMNTKFCKLLIIFSCARLILMIKFILVPPHSWQMPTHFVCCGLATALPAAVG